MYNAFFGFDEKPFTLTPNTKYLYLSEQHESVIRTLLYGIEERVGFMMLSGEVGSGKTTTVRALLNLVQESVETSLILNPLLSNLDLLKAINKDFGNACESDSMQVQIETLNKYLLGIASRGKTALVIIDEAQNLPFEAFEMTRMLSNLETESQKLINILLVGQPELVSIVSNRRLRQLAQRIQIHVRVPPMTLPQTAEYILHRLHNAGEKVAAHFESKAIRRIHRKSGGIPRIVNAICDMSLIAAYGRNTYQIDNRIIRQALREVPAYVYRA